MAPRKYSLLFSNALEHLITLVVIFCIIPHILIIQYLTEIYSSVLVRFGNFEGSDAANIKSIYYWISIAISLILLYIYCKNRFSFKRYTGNPHRMLADAVAIFGMIFIASSVFASKNYVLLRPYWIIYPIDVFYITYLFFDIHQFERIIKKIVIACGLQSLYAILYYLLNIHQYVTPHFGRRTQGTFDSPNSLYPLLIICIPIAIALVQNRGNMNNVIGFFVVLLCVFALLLTFSRSGWLALICCLLCFVILNFKAKQNLNAGLCLVISLFCIILFISTIYIRTNGSTIGGVHDRSFWGRLAIWENASHLVARHFWLGSGAGTFPIEQEKYYSTKLVQFNACNIDAKSLYLNIAVEQGILGLTSFVYIILLVCNVGKTVTMNSYIQRRSLDVASMSSIFGIVICGLFDTPILQGNTTAVSLVFFILIAYLSLDQTTLD